MKKNIVKNEETLTDAEKNKLQNEIKDLNKKVENIEREKDSIHNINLRTTTNQLKKFIKEKKESKTYDFDRDGFDRDGFD